MTISTDCWLFLVSSLVHLVFQSTVFMCTSSPRCHPHTWTREMVLMLLEGEQDLLLQNHSGQHVNLYQIFTVLDLYLNITYSTKANFTHKTLTVPWRRSHSHHFLAPYFLTLFEAVPFTWKVTWIKGWNTELIIIFGLDLYILKPYCAKSLPSHI